MTPGNQGSVWGRKGLEAGLSRGLGPAGGGQGRLAKGWRCNLLTLAESRDCWEENKNGPSKLHWDLCWGGVSGALLTVPEISCVPLVSATTQVPRAGRPAVDLVLPVTSPAPRQQDSQLHPSERV